jgi:excisionase family DNA binding protein
MDGRCGLDRLSTAANVRPVAVDVASAVELRIPEVAEQLGISRAKLYELIAGGDLPSVKIGGCRRVRASDLVAYVDALGAATSMQLADKEDLARSQRRPGLRLT